MGKRGEKRVEEGKQHLLYENDAPAASVKRGKKKAEKEIFHR